MSDLRPPTSDNASHCSPAGPGPLPPSGHVMVVGPAAGPAGTLAFELRHRGHHVTRVESGSEACPLAARVHPDLVVLVEEAGGQPVQVTCQQFRADPELFGALILELKEDPRFGPAEAPLSSGGPDMVLPAGTALCVLVAQVELLLRLRRTEYALRESRQLQRTLIDEAPVGMAQVTLDGVVGSVNQSMTHLLRMSFEALLGVSFFDLIHPVGRESVRARLHALALGDPHPVQCETQFLTSAGTGVWTQLHAILRRDEKGLPVHFAITVIDSASLQEAQAAAARRDGLLRDLSELTNDFLLEFDERGRILEVNRAFAQALGRRAGDFVGRMFEEFAFEHARDTWRPGLARVVSGQGDETVRLELGGPDGGRIRIEGRLCLRVGDTGPVVRAVFRDISERVRLEEQLLRTQRMESIGTLAGGIAHDLNNVLAPVLLCVGLIRSGCSDNERREFLRIIEKSALRGSDLVRQVLTFARGAEGETMPMHPKHVAREIVSMLRETFPKTVRVVYDLPTELWLVLGNATQLNQVLLNLCVNARDAMPHGGTLSIIGRNKVLTSADLAIHPEARLGEYVTLSVCDTGTGIPERIRDRIFDAFFTTKSPGQGTGLGLSTALGIVRAHGGFIALETEEGKGTSFHVHLPAHNAGTVAPAVASAEPVPRGARELVLVVDDERSVRDIVEKTLSDHGYRVVTANDGIEAVARFMAFGPEIKVLVTDLLMPRLDGPAAIRAIRKSYPDIVIVAMSGNPPDGIAEDPEAAGIDRFIAKPFMVEELLRTVHEALQSVRARAAMAKEPASSPSAPTRAGASAFNPA